MPTAVSVCLLANKSLYLKLTRLDVSLDPLPAAFCLDAAEQLSLPVLARYDLYVVQPLAGRRETGKTVKLNL